VVCYPTEVAVLCDSCVVDIDVFCITVD